MKEAVTKVTDTLTQEDFDGAFQKLLERFNKCIAVIGDYFVCVLSIKVPIWKKSNILWKFVKELMILFHRIPAASWGHMVSTIKRGPSEESSSFFSTLTAVSNRFKL